MKKFYLGNVLTGVLIMVLSTSCSQNLIDFDNEEWMFSTPKHDYSRHIEVDLSKDYKGTKRENKQIIEAFGRIVENLSIVGDSVRIDGITYNDLNINKEFFDGVCLLIKDVDPKLMIGYMNNRKKTRGNGESMPDEFGYQQDMGFALIVIMTYIYSQATHELVFKMFNRYFCGLGDYQFSSDEFQDISAIAVEKRPDDWTSYPCCNVNNIELKRIGISFYHTSLGLALGTSTVYFNNSGTPAGINDTYNFDAQAWGSRPFPAEIITRIIGAFGEAYGAKSFRYSYGYYE